jgi:hypothetical protein
MIVRVLGVFLASLLLCLCINAVAQIPDAIGIWTFDEDKMGTDVSGNENHGEPMGDTALTDGKFGKGLELNGVDQCIEVPDSDSLDVDDDQVTMTCWFWWAGSGDDWQTFVSKGPMSGTNENWAFFINTGSIYTHFIITPNGARTNVDSPGGAFDAEAWHFVAGTYDGSTVKIYIDGDMVKEEGRSGNLTPNDSSLRIGHREGSPHWWNGVLDEVGVFNRALSEDEVNRIMNEGLGAIYLSVEPSAKMAITWGQMKK